MVKGEFKFRKHQRLGAEGAEEDQEYLFDTFIDTGDLGVLRDTESPFRIVVGRTGSGKTALLMLLQDYEEHVAWIEPDGLALQYLSNSTILQQLDDLGIDLDIFYRLLWRHVFAVELIKLKYQLVSEQDKQHFLLNVLSTFSKDKKKEAALKYLREWGERFWEDTEVRIKEVTHKLERDLAMSLGISTAALKTELGAGKVLGVEEKAELVQRLQSVVNEVQIQKLGQVIELLAEEVLTDSQESFFVIIDRLDEQWVPDNVRYRLLRALIETIRDLQKIRTAKVIIALRWDLLQRVFRETRDSGFQEEKYEPLFLKLRWSKKQLLSVLDSRIRHLVRTQYTKRQVGLKQVFPSKVGKSNINTYLVERTLYRPRDMIQFGNFCIAKAIGRSELTETLVREAEREYSERRFRSLGDEWSADYPDLLSNASTLKRRPATFPVQAISLEEIEELCVSSIGAEEQMEIGRVRPVIRDVFRGNATLDQLRVRIVRCFYEVGLVGLRLGKNQRTSWSFKEGFAVKEAEIGENTRIVINPTFFRVLGVDPR